MNKKSMTLLAGAFLLTQLMFGQGELDALKYGQTDIKGTARYMGMGGAFNALGGDISSISTNPAGVGVYRSSELAGTVGLNLSSTSTQMLGTKSGNDLFKATFDNIGFVGSFYNPGGSSGLLSFNFGVTYNKVKNYNRSYNANSRGFSGAFSDYMALITDGTFCANLDVDEADFENGKLTAYDNYDWLSVLGWNGYAFDLDERDIAGETYEGIGELNASNITVNERGGVDEYNFSFGGNVSNVLYFGASLGITDLNYKMTSLYEEQFSDGSDNRSYKLFNNMETRGTGYNGKFGLIVRPVDFMRIGVSFHTPTWYAMRDYYDAQIDWNYPDNLEGEDIGYTYTPRAYTDYKFKTPLKVAAGLAFVIGKKGILSFDYEMTDASTMTLADGNGRSDTIMNDRIKQNNSIGHTFKVGGELRVTPEFSLRLGGAAQLASTTRDFQDNNVEAFFVGTVPHFSVDRGVYYGTLGAGYRMGSFFVDAAFVYRTQQENFYYYTNTYDVRGNVLVPASKGTLNTNNYNLVLTLGKRF